MSHMCYVFLGFGKCSCVMSSYGRDMSVDMVAANNVQHGSYL